MENLKRRQILICLGLVILVLICVGVSYAYWRMTLVQEDNNRVSSSCLSIELIDETAPIKMDNAYPLTDEEGMQITPYTFTIKNTCDTFISYEISLGMTDTTSLNSQYVAAVLDYNEIQTLDSYEAVTIEGYKEGRVLQKGSLSQDDEVTYNLRLWLDEDVTMDDVDAINKYFEANVVVTAAVSTYNPIDFGFTKLADAMLVNEYQSTDMDHALTKISNKQKPNFLNSAPVMVWDEIHPYNTSSAYTNTSNYIGTSYEFNEDTGYYTILNYGDHQLYTDIDNETYASGDYYTCVGSMSMGEDGTPNYWRPTSCTTMYKIISAEEINVDSETRYQIQGYAYTQVERESDTSDRGLYVGEDDYGTTYYYRGNVTNNYVYFADVYWRIVRLNGDGSVRLLYDGTTPDSENVLLGTSLFNNYDTNHAYAGFMYGENVGTSYEENIQNTVDSTIKTQLDNLYNSTILTAGLENYIADSGFCNDRSIASGDGYSNETYYNALNRFTSGTPSFKCSSQNDLFTVTNEKGNQALTYPIGLITTDELAYAGMRNEKLNRLSYVYSKDTYWTMTPAYYSTDIRIGSLNYQGMVDVNAADTEFGIRPVINLKNEVEISGGIGTKNDPFVISVQ